ncbi:unnamed protein product, partial [Prorocentrum cordatum]
AVLAQEKALITVAETGGPPQLTSWEKPRSAAPLVRRAAAPHARAMDVEVINRCAIPAATLAAGGLLLMSEHSKTAGRLLCFCGAQTGMNLYMKHVLSHQAISEGRDGFPAACAVTGLQQLTGFALMVAWMGVSRFTSYQYVPKRLNSRMDYIAVFTFSCAFIANIALNNYSVSLMPISVNLIVRSCFPLPTFFAQKLASWCTGERAKDSSTLELSLMLFGCFCASLAVFAKMQSADTVGSDHKNLAWGVIVCVISCFAGSSNLVLAGMMGTNLKLNEFDTITYSALPAAVLLMPAMFISHYVHWDDGVMLTDWEILREVWELNPSVVYLAALSGVFALAFNLLKYGIVQRLSATHTAFAGNFNKAFTIVLATAQGLEPYPSDYWGWVMVASYVGNISAFTGYNIAKIQIARAQEEEPRTPRSACSFEKEPLQSESTEDSLEKHTSSEEDDWESCKVAADDSCRSDAARSLAIGRGGSEPLLGRGGPAATPLAGSDAGDGGGVADMA